MDTPLLTNENPSSWGSALFLALGLHGLLLAAGFYSATDSLLELIQQGESPAIPPTAHVVQSVKPEEVEIELVSEPEFVADPEFVVPIEEPAPVVGALPEPSLEVVEDALPDPFPEPELPPEPVPVIAGPAPAPIPLVEAPVSLVTNTLHDSAVPTEAVADALTGYAAQEAQIGNKNFPKPPYPIEAKSKRFQGTVVVSISIQNGKIIHAGINSSSGYGILDRSATSWIKQRWKFADNINRTLIQPVSFQLE